MKNHLKEEVKIKSPESKHKTVTAPTLSDKNTVVAKPEETTANSKEEMDQTKVEKEHQDTDHKHEYIAPVIEGKGILGQQPVIVPQESKVFDKTKKADPADIKFSNQNHSLNQRKK